MHLKFIVLISNGKNWSNLGEMYLNNDRKLTFTSLLVAKLLYKYLCPYVRPSVRMSVCPSGLGGNAIFLAPN